MAAEGNIDFGIAAFVDKDQLAVAKRVGGLHDHPRHLAESVGAGQHPTQGIKRCGVKAAGDDDRIGAETVKRGQDQPLHRFQIVVMAGAGGQGDVQVEAEALALPTLIRPARVQRIVPVLMKRDRQHFGVGQEDRLGAVAVMHVPIEDGDAPCQAMCLCRAHGNCDVVQQAKAIRPVGQRVVPRRARQGIGVSRLPAQDGHDRADGKARRKGGDFITAATEGGAQAKFPAACIRCRLEGIKIACRMDAQQILAAGLGRSADIKIADQARHIQQVLQAPLGFGVFGQATAGLDKAAHRQGQGVVAAAMPEAAFVGEEGRA